MSENSETPIQLSRQQQSLLEQIVHRFEDCFGRGEQPVIEEFLPRDVPASVRRAVLIELVHVDHELRRKAGDAAGSARDYISRFPELSGETGLLTGALTLPVLQDDADKNPARRKPAPGSRTGHLSTVMPGTVLANTYEILDMIGVGGMGMVFKAKHSRMKRIVAIKMLRPSVMEIPGMVRRFQREVVAVSKLVHPNIVVAYDCLEVEDNHYLVMEYVQGVDLARYIKEHGPLPIETAVSYILQAASGLQHAHRQGIVHRDIKPANLMLDNSGKVKILDLGLARLRRGMNSTDQSNDCSQLTDQGDAMGTVDFMSPEQSLDARNAGRRSDVYSLGCTLYYLLTRRPVYGGRTALARILAHRTAPIPSLRAERAEVPPQIDGIFQRMVAKTKEERYRSMTPVIEDLNNWGEVEWPPQAPTTDASVPE
jgi:serine/threonine protein kinase